MTVNDLALLRPARPSGETKARGFGEGEDAIAPGWAR